jgi:large subunit ribosomal protein L4
VVVIDALEAVEKTKAAAEMLARFGAAQSALLVDVKPAEMLVRAVRNIPGAVCLESGRLKARDVMRARRVIATRAAVERLQEVLGS